MILIRPETKPDDVHGMVAAKGILTARGGATSHAAVVARQFGIPAVCGADSLQINLNDRTATTGGHTLKEGDWVSIDGARGEAYLGQLAMVNPSFEEQEDLVTLLKWADQASAQNTKRRGGQAASWPSGVGQCRLPQGRRARPRLRRQGHRPVPHRAHVLRGCSACRSCSA